MTEKETTEQHNKRTKHTAICWNIDKACYVCVECGEELKWRTKLGKLSKLLTERLVN